MTLRLTIQNERSLPDGGPLSVEISGKRGIDIGRDQYLDWTLPDPTRTISGKHCEVRFRDGGYWLHDLSTNGTFLNGSERRMQGAHRFRDGDRIEIGHYIIGVTLDEDAAGEVSSSAPASRPFGSAEFWEASGGAAPPLPRRAFSPAANAQPVRPDFLDWALDAPSSVPSPARPEPALPQQPPFQPPPMGQELNVPPEPSARRLPEGDSDDMVWAQGPTPVPFQVEPLPPIPMPRRPSPTPAPPANAWSVSEPVPDAAPESPFVTRAEPRDAPIPEEFPDAGRPPFAAPPPYAAAPAIPSPPPFTGPPTSAAAPPVPEAGSAEFVRRFAAGAGIPKAALAGRDAGELAEELGTLMRLVAEDLKLLLAARAESKRFARSSDQTTIQALDNNPLKFSPTAENALSLMFGRSVSGYLDARATFQQSFRDLKIHQVKTYGAMQQSVRMLIEDLDPEVIEESVSPAKGLGGLLGSHKAKLWDAYVTRWRAKAAPHEDGLVDAFMIYFAECYDRGGSSR